MDKVLATCFEHFKDEEFTKCIPSCHLTDMNFEFMVGIENARIIAGVPFIINSAYRTKEHELSRGRKGTSSHCKGLALDIQCKDSVTRLAILKGLIEEGFSRIGIHERFIHVDADTTKPACIWLYGQSTLFADEF